MKIDDLTRIEDTDSDDGFLQWVKNNRDIVKEYIKANDVSIKDVPLETRTYNALRINDIRLLSEFALEDLAELDKFNMLDRNASFEIKAYVNEYFFSRKKEILAYAENKNNESHHQVYTSEAEKAADVLYLKDRSLYQIKNMLYNKASKEKIFDIIKDNDIVIESLDLSVRLYNCLKRSGINTLCDMLSLYPDDFSKLKNMGYKSVNEACETVENQVLKIINDSSLEIVTSQSNEKQKKEMSKTSAAEDYQNLYLKKLSEMSVTEILQQHQYRDMALEYIKANDVGIDSFGFTARCEHAFKYNDIKSLSLLLPKYPRILHSFKGLGQKSIDEIQKKIDSYLEKIQCSVAAYCCGNTKALYSDEWIEIAVMRCFSVIGFKGLSYSEIRQNLPENIEDERIKKRIGKLIAEKKLEYVDFRCYKIYPSFIDTIYSLKLDDKVKDMLIKRLNGITLEEVAVEYGLTRERVRQICSKNFVRVKSAVYNATGSDLFDEDYYVYLYTNYDIEKEVWLKYLNVPIATYNYLASYKTKGKKELEDALSDSAIDLNMKFRIRDYLNRNKILLDDVLVDRKRPAIENYAIEKLCKDEVDSETFAQKYNSLLSENDIEYDEDIYYTDAIKRSRVNKLSSSMICLYKQGEKFRYYDISSRDYTELLEILNLEGFKNTDISTLKFIEDYPALMEKYDIRDQYELHNLLKKIVDVSKYNNMSFGRQPTIHFGQFDRNAAFLEIISVFSPVTAEDLCEYIHEEYGFEKNTVLMTYLTEFKEYYHNGIYRVDFKKIPEDKKSVLIDALTEDFYYTAEIKKMYTEMFDGADTEEINPFTLKSLGFNVYNTYVIKNYPSAEFFFKSILTEKDIFSLEPYRKRFGSINAFGQAFRELQVSKDLFVFDGNQVINFRRIAKAGITKEDIENFCIEVKNFVREGQYFTIHSLRKKGFESKLDVLGFDDSFYSNIIAMNNSFAYQHVFGNIVLYSKNDAVFSISIKSFILDTLSQYESVDLDYFIEDIKEKYGIVIPERHEVKSVIKNTDFYYDSIMDKIYRNKEYYYAEFDD